MRITDFQALQFVTVLVNGTPIATSITNNAAKARSRGFEADATWRIGPLNLNAMVGHNDAEFTDYRNANSAGADFTGNNPGGPDWSWSIAGEYTLRLGGWGTASLWTQWTKRTELYLDAANTPRRITDDLSEVNARLRFLSESERFGISLFANNLLNRDYVALAFTDAAVVDSSTGSIGRAGTYNPPRNFGVSLEFSF
jgi:iron complex outermembrane receptor protein